MLILPKLTKSYILERISEEQIMEYYLGIPIIPEFFINNSFLSPFRNQSLPDKSPTCNYYYSSKDNRLRVRDWNGSFHGDCFDVASFMTKINTNTKQGFVFLLHKIASDFKIHKYQDSTTKISFDLDYKKYTHTASLKVIKVTPRKFDYVDKSFWYNDRNVSRDLLLKGKVYPIERLDIEGRDGYLYNTYNYSRNNPAYGYYGGKINNIDIWKIYTPFNKDKRYKFITNYNFIQGYHLIKPARILIITKSYKDALSIRSYGFEAIAVASETHLISKDIMFRLKTMFDLIVTLFDYDKTGIILANKYKRIYNCPPIMFTKGRFNQPNFGTKDFTDFRQLFGHQRTLKLIDETLNKFEDFIALLNKQCYERELFIKYI